MTALSHTDKNGAEIKLGDLVRHGDREGRVLILEYSGTIYVDRIGYWGDCKALDPSQVEVVAEAPKARKGVKIAGPTPDGSYVERRTPNKYDWAVAIVSQQESTYKPRDPKAVNGYIPNPDLGKWISFSWHARRDLAAKSQEKAQRLGYRACIVPVVS